MTPGIIKKNNIHIAGNINAAESIIFAHGFGTDQTSFSSLIKYFEKNYRIILFDNVGGGKADIAAYNPARYQTLDAYATDLLDICRYYQLKEAIYVGHSVSGMTGVLASIKKPQYFSKLILLGASPRYLNDSTTNYTGGFEQKDLDTLYQSMSSNYHAWASGFSAIVMSNSDRPQLAASFAETLSAIRPDIALKVAKTIFESDYRNVLNKINKPVLIIQTANDIAVPEEVGNYLLRHIADSTLIKVNTHGHFPQVSAPEEVAEAIEMFIQPK